MKYEGQKEEKEKKRRRTTGGTYFDGAVRAIGPCVEETRPTHDRDGSDHRLETDVEWGTLSG